MTLSEFAQLVDSPGKWVLNTLAALDPGAAYTLELAGRLVLTRAIHGACSMPLAEAWKLAPRVLAEWDGSTTPVTLRVHPLDDVSLTVDVYRVLASLHVRRATCVEREAHRVRGRPRTRAVDPITDAQAWGLDLSLIHDNLRKSPADRLRQLDAMHAFSSRTRRVTPTVSERSPAHV